MAGESRTYPARLTIDYPERLDRVTTCFRPILVVPIVILFAILTASNSTHVVTETGRTVKASGLGVTGGLAVATALMILVRQRYPRWWFDFALELARFAARIGAYLTLLTDRSARRPGRRVPHRDSGRSVTPIKTRYVCLGRHWLDRTKSYQRWR
jgi:hypothetical protein